MGKPGRAFVDLDGQVAIFCDGEDWKSQSVQPLSFPDVSKTLAEAEKIKKSLQIPKNKLEKEMQNKRQRQLRFIGPLNIGKDSSRDRPDKKGAFP